MATRHEHLEFAVCKKGRHDDCPRLIFQGQGGDLIEVHCTCTCGHTNEEAAWDKLIAATRAERGW